jgi:hypothetical protein
MRRILVSLMALLVAAAPPRLHAQGTGEGEVAGGGGGGRQALFAARATVPPVLDGRLDDPVWRDAAVATGFVQRAPRPGAPATERTEARVAWDDQAIYVAIRAWDSAPDSIASQLARRDATGIFSDWVEVLIDSYHDRRSGYRFSVNPHGVKKDVFHFNDRQEDLSWDAVWEVATRVDDQGWTAEFRIPLSQIRYAPGSGPQSWGIQFSRTIARHEEISFWAPVLPNAPGFVSVAGVLDGLRDLGSPRRMEVVPYLVSRATRAPEPAGPVPSPFWRATRPAASAGADLKYGLTSNLTVTATLNPDFGQVEADPAVVNLGAFETFYPERRPFFLEGANLFTFDVGDDNSGEGLFYSRRIGRAPQRGGLGGDHVDMPEATRILGAGKLTGRVGDWSMGFFNAVTGAEQARVFRGGVLEAAPVEPMTNYAVGRVNRDFREGGSTLGLLVTATNRRIDDDAFLFLRSAAYSGGVTGLHRFGADGRYQVGGFLAGTSIHGDTAALRLAQLAPQRYFQRPDATHLEFDPTRTSMQGVTGLLGLSRIGAGRLNGGVGTRFRTPGFEVNDMGYHQNSDNALVYLWSNYNGFQPGPLFRRWAAGLNPNAGWDWGGTRLWTQVNSWGNATLHNFWGVNFFANHRWDGTSPGALRGGPALHAPGSNNFGLNLNGDRRRPVVLSAGVNGSREHGTGTLRWGTSAGLSARPSPRLELALNPGLNRHRSEWQYVATPLAASARRPEYIFAAIDQTTLSLTTRLNYTFTPDLSLQFYAQPFISAGSYSDFRRVAEPRAPRFHERFHTFAPAELRTEEQGRRMVATLEDGDEVRFSNPDFAVRSLRANAVMRWEYRPGSALFLVWSHGRSDRTGEGSFDFGRDLDGLRRLQGTNALMLKLNYWLNL